MILHRLTGMLIRRLLLFFGFLLDLSMLDSITVLPIFFSLSLGGSPNETPENNDDDNSSSSKKKDALMLVNKLLFRIATADFLPPFFAPLTTHTAYYDNTEALCPPPGSRFGREGTAPRRRVGVTLTVYRCYATDRASDKCVSLPRLHRSGGEQRRSLPSTVLLQHFLGTRNNYLPKANGNRRL